METCSVAHLADSEMFDCFEWGSSVGVRNAHCGGCWFQLLLAQYSVVFYVHSRVTSPLLFSSSFFFCFTLKRFVFFLSGLDLFMPIFISQLSFISLYFYFYFSEVWVLLLFSIFCLTLLHNLSFTVFIWGFSPVLSLTGLVFILILLSPFSIF